MLNDFISLIYPKNCASCGNSLFKHEECLCTFCRYHLPKTNFHLQTGNPVEKLFWGRADLVSAAAYYAFGKGGKVQHLIHQLKYNGKKEIGLTIGKLYGHELKQSRKYETVDTIIPVPLHDKKKKKRGYNQSEYFAEGLSKSLNISTDTTTLIRGNESETQTKKSKYSRWQNVESIFHVVEPGKLENKHILLVDDVVTTGSTLEACALTLLKIPNVKVSVATIAFANN
ncbi:MAG: ComF family protein [Bacteroidia bacterium]|nr:ComF family protein [Bacteroidia bacterium]